MPAEFHRSPYGTMERATDGRRQVIYRGLAPASKWWRRLARVRMALRLAVQPQDPRDWFWRPTEN